MQAMKVFTTFRVLNLVPVFLNMAFLFGLFSLSIAARDWCIPDKDQNHQSEARSEKWDEVAEEAENDLAGLCLSFLLVQGIIFILTGSSGHSHESSGHHEVGHPIHVTVILLVVGITFAAITVFMVWFQAHSDTVQTIEVQHDRIHATDNFRKYLLRWYFIVQTLFAMSFAWCLLYVLNWELLRLLGILGFTVNAHSTVFHTILALVVSFVAFAFIRILDLIEDMEETGEVADKCTRSMIESLAILIGFSWEHAFDGGVEVIADLTREGGYWQPYLLKFTLAVLVALVIAPAWRLYILKIVLELDEIQREYRRENTVYNSDGRSRLSVTELEAVPRADNRSDESPRGRRWYRVTSFFRWRREKGATGAAGIHPV